MADNGGGARSYKNNGGCIVTPPTPTYTTPTRDYSRAYERAEAYTQSKQYVSQSVQTTYNQKIEAQAAWNQHVQRQERIEQQVTKYSYKKGGNTSVVTAEEAKKEAVQVYNDIRQTTKDVIEPQTKKYTTANSKTNNILNNLKNGASKFLGLFDKAHGSLEDRAKQACKTDSDLTEWNRLKERYQHLKENILRAIEGISVHKVIYADLKSKDPTLESRSDSNITIKNILEIKNSDSNTKKRPDIVSYDIVGGHVYEIKPISYLTKEELAIQQLEKYLNILDQYKKNGESYIAGGDLIIDTIMAPGVKNVTKTSYGATVTYWQNSTNGIIYYEVDYDSSLVRIKQTVEQTSIIIGMIIIGGFLIIGMNNNSFNSSFAGGY